LAVVIFPWNILLALNELDDSLSIQNTLAIMEVALGSNILDIYYSFVNQLWVTSSQVVPGATPFSGPPLTGA
jgi:hypothetical protein